jgi:hypothetical protein
VLVARLPKADIVGQMRFIERMFGIYSLISTETPSISALLRFALVYFRHCRQVRDGAGRGEGGELTWPSR